jgi:propanediol dehydratase large subunit
MQAGPSTLRTAVRAQLVVSSLVDLAVTSGGETTREHSQIAAFARTAMDGFC